MKIKPIQSKKAAMEMSVGTMVTIVLLMVVLVMGIFFIRQIFGTATTAIDGVDAEIQGQIQTLFDQEGREMAVYPTSRRVSIEQGSSGYGIAFSIHNRGTAATFDYNVTARETDCPDRLSTEDANRYVFGGRGSVSLSEGGSIDPPRLITFNVPENAPLCTIIYDLNSERDGSPGPSADFIVTIV